MFEKLKSILSKVDSNYADIRYEVKKETSITFNGKELTQIGSNSTDGYVAFKQTSLQDSIDSYDTQIAQLEALLQRKQETLTNRYVAMEMAMSKIQTQSNWLASQIGSLYNPNTTG